MILYKHLHNCVSKHHSTNATYNTTEFVTAFHLAQVIYDVEKKSPGCTDLNFYYWYFGPVSIVNTWDGNCILFKIQYSNFVHKLNL